MASFRIQSRPRKIMKIICILALFISAGAKKLPSYITPCQRNSDIPSCILSNLEAARPYLSNGIPRLSIPPLNPFNVPKAFMSLANFTFEGKKINFQGVDEVQFKDLNVDLNQRIFNVKLLLPLLNATGEYVMKGSILGLNVDGVSVGWGTMKNILMSVQLKGVEKLINEKLHLDFRKVGFELVSLDGGNLFLDNLIRDNPEMTKQANEFLNRPNIFKAFMVFVEPMYDQVFGGIFAEVVRNIFLKFPLEQLFPRT